MEQNTKLGKVILHQHYSSCQLMKELNLLIHINVHKSLIILCVNVQKRLAAVCKMNLQVNYKDYVNEQELNYVHFEWVKN